MAGAPVAVDGVTRVLKRFGRDASLTGSRPVKLELLGLHLCHDGGSRQKVGEVQEGALRRFRQVGRALGNTGRGRGGRPTLKGEWRSEFDS